MDLGFNMPLYRKKDMTTQINALIKPERGSQKPLDKDDGGGIPSATMELNSPGIVLSPFSLKLSFGRSQS